MKALPFFKKKKLPTQNQSDDAALWAVINDSDASNAEREAALSKILRAHDTATTVVTCHQYKKAGTVYHLQIPAGADFANVMHKARTEITTGADAQGQNFEVTTNWKYPLNHTDNCLVCGNPKILICRECFALSCCEHGKPWQCPNCPENSSAVTVKPYPVMTASKPNQHLVAGRNSAIAPPNPVKLPKSR